MGVQFQEVSDWIFEVEEISAGVYKVAGVDLAGHKVESTGGNPDLLLEKCKVWDLEIEQNETTAPDSAVQ